jgi:hypothetical protein
MNTKRAKKHEEPSAESLREIPPIDFSKTVHFGRGPEALQRGLEWARARRGRPPKGETAEGTRTKTIRFPEKLLTELERTAEKRGVTLHAAMREAITEWIAS